MLLSTNITKLSFSNFCGQQEELQNLIAARAVGRGHTVHENARVIFSEFVSLAFSRKNPEFRRKGVKCITLIKSLKRSFAFLLNYDKRDHKNLCA